MQRPLSVKLALADIPAARVGAAPIIERSRIVAASPVARLHGIPALMARRLIQYNAQIHQTGQRARPQRPQRREAATRAVVETNQLVEYSSADTSA